MNRFHTILHPTDFEEKSVQAFQLACDLARQNDADLVLLHVAPKGVVRYLDKVSERDTAQTHEHLWSALRKQQADEESLQVSHRLEEGAPTSAIQRVAREIEADLIVIGPSSSSSLPLCWLTSSTLDELVHKAPCSVLVARPPMKDSESLATEEQAAEAVLASMAPTLAP